MVYSFCRGALARRYVVLLFQQGERGIHGARAGGVGAAATLFDGLDDFIAVARTDLDQRQHDQRQVAAAKDALGPFAAPAPATGAAMAHAVAALVAPRGPRPCRW